MPLPVPIPANGGEPPQSLSEFYQERSASGLDLYNAAADLDQGYYTQLDNLYVSGHKLVCRPGKQAQWSAALAAPIYGLFTFYDSAGAAWALFVSSGKLYKSLNGSSAAPTELLLNGTTSFSTVRSGLGLSGAQVQFARYGAFAYFSDGVGTLYRTNLTTTVPVSGLLAPTVAALAGLTFGLPPGSVSLTPTQSSSSAFSGTNLTTDSVFADTTLGAGHPWTGFGNSPDFGYPPPLPGNWLWVDDALEGIQSTNAFANSSYSDASGEYFTRLYVGVNCFNGPGASGQGVRLQATAYSGASGTGTTATQFIDIYPGYTGGAAVLVDTVFDFTGIGFSILSWRVSYGGAARNVNAAHSNNDGPHLQTAIAYPYCGQFVASTGNRWQPSYSAGAIGQYGKTATGRITLDMGSDHDWSAYNTLFVSLSGLATTLTTPSIGLVLRLKSSAASTYTQTNNLIFSADGTYAYVDTTTLPLAVRQAIRYAQILFLSDEITTTNPGPTFSLGAISSAGNLSIGAANYQWTYTEINSSGDVTLSNIIESNPAPYSNSVAPLGSSATGLLLLPSAPLNTSSDRWVLSRSGGAFSDGLTRVVDAGTWSETWNFGNTSRMGDTYPGVQLAPNPYTQWGIQSAPSGKKYLLDNTPDSALVGNPTVISGRDPAPAGVLSLCVWQNRLWLATKDAIYGSWLLTASGTASLYFNVYSSPSDPNLLIKGFYSGVNPGGGDPIQKLNPYGSLLMVRKLRSDWIVEGTDPSNFSLNQFASDPAISQGIVAPGTSILTPNHLVGLFPSGLKSFDGGRYRMLSRAIRPLLVPTQTEQGGVIAPSAMAGAFCIFYNEWLLLFAPGLGDSHNTTCYVFDTTIDDTLLSESDGSGMSGAWVRWQQMTIASAAIVQNGNDSYDLWLGGLDGMLYKLTGNGDTAAAGAAAQPISFALMSRAFGRPNEGLSPYLQRGYGLSLGMEDRAWEFYYSRLIPNHLYVETNAPQPVSLLCTVTETDTGVSDSRAYLFPAGLQNRRLKVGRLEGYGLQVSVSGSSATGFKLNSFGLTATIGRQDQ